MKSVGIDIGSSSIKIVEVLSSSKGFQVTRYTEHPLNIAPGADQDLEIIEYLRDFVTQFDASQTRFVLGLRQDRVAIRNKFFPFNDRIKISKSLPFELEEDIPFSAENAIFDAKIIRTIGTGAEVLACAAPKHHVKAALERAKDASIDPFVLSSEGIAFANTIERWDEPPAALLAPALSLDGDEQKPVRHLHLVLNIGHTRTLVCAFEGGSLVAVRSILWGGKNISEAIAQKYEIPFLDAVKELETKGFILTNKQGATFDQITFSDTIAKSVRELARDIQLSMLELKSEFNGQITDIALVGGASQIKNMGAFLTQVLEAPVNKGSSIELVPNVLFDRSPQVGAKCGIALGLAIEGFKKPRNPALNFLRGDFAKENHALKLFWNKWGNTVKVASALLVVLFVYTSLRQTFTLNLSDRTQEALKDQAKVVANLKGRAASESGIKKYIRDNKKRAADLKTLSSVANMNSALDVMKRVSESIPARNAIQMEVRALDVRDELVVLQGYVNSPNEMRLLQQALTNVSSDGKVNSQNATIQPSPGKTSFSFKFNVDRGVQKVTR